MAPPMLIFDFDNTLIEGDSDEWVAGQFGAGELFQEMRSQGKPWNEAMHAVLGVLHARGVTVEQIEEALCSIAMQAETVGAIKAAHQLGCQLCILSDANSFFIHVVLNHHRLLPLFSQIHTNPSWLDSNGRLHVGSFNASASLSRHPPFQNHLVSSGSTPARAAPTSCQNQFQPYVEAYSACPIVAHHNLLHTCPLCPPNLCKGRVLDAIRAVHLATSGQPKMQIVYAGDGPGDLCPSLRLTSEDCLLPRHEYPLSQLLSRGYLALVKATVYPWDFSLASSLDYALQNH